MRDVALECHVAEVRLEIGLPDQKLCCFKCLRVRNGLRVGMDPKALLLSHPMGAFTPIRMEELWLVVVVSLP
jgi:hypothetical protein